MAFRKKRKDPFTEIQSCLQRRDYKGALDWFNTLLQKDPKNTQIRLRFADTLVLAGSKRDAVKQYRIVADELSEKGFMIRAIAINKKILQLDPKQQDVHERLAEMSRERPVPPGKTTSLADVLTQPDAPLRRYSEPAAPAPPAPEPPPPASEPPATLPDLSLEDSMALEFGAPPDESVEEPAPPSPPTVSEEPIPAPPPPEEPEAVPLPEEPSFSEEPMEFGGAGVPDDDEEDEVEVVTLEADSSEPEREAEAGAESEPELVLEGVEEPAEASPEIVLDFEQEPEAKRVDAEVEPELSAESGDEYQTGEMEVVAFELDAEPAEAEGGAEPLLAALGEDIDSLIDSIIDDVGTSASANPAEEEKAPTHIPLFSDLTSSEFIDVALLLYRRVAKMGETIVKEGDPGDSMFIVSTGEVRATVERDGQQIPVATMKDGGFFGEMAVLSGEPRTATVTAVKATELLELNRENLREICSRHPHVEAKIRLAYDERVARAHGR